MATAFVPPPFPDYTKRINIDPDMIARMEKDLTDKATAIFAAAQVDGGVFGVFSLDDLELKTESDLCHKIAVGVGYAGAEPWDPAKYQGGSAPGGKAARAVEFVYSVILAVPTGEMCDERGSATMLLTLLRNGIFGSTISGDSTNRTWAFVKELPNINVSTDTMLYYTQVWRVDLPVVSAP